MSGLASGSPFVRPLGGRLSRRSKVLKTFKRGDHVEWNSEAGRVRGVITKKVTSDVPFKGYVHHATRAEPQYFIQSDKTDHIAIHKGSALKLSKPHSKKEPKKAAGKRRKAER